MIPCILIHSNHNSGAKFASECAVTIKNNLEKNKFTIKEFQNENATPTKIHSLLKQNKCKYMAFFSFGHGNETNIFGFNDETIINNDSSKMLVNKLCYVLACSVAKSLGKKIVTDGAKCFLGYEKKFRFVTLEPYRSIFQVCSNSGIISLIENKTTIKIAYQTIINSYNKKIRELTLKVEEDRYLVFTLIFLEKNRNCLSLIGEENVTLF